MSSSTESREWSIRRHARALHMARRHNRGGDVATATAWLDEAARVRRALAA
ncbi:hypothetical protein GS504_01425 [Rhodococcus hoagii]|nr:hypothetical protein [Prescottella equi]NKS71666.1 hypothetical protein [Prescottella equi]